MDARFKFYKMEGADNDITLTYPLDGQIQGISIGFNVYEDCRGIIKETPMSYRHRDSLLSIRNGWLQNPLAFPGLSSLRVFLLRRL